MGEKIKMPRSKRTIACDITPEVRQTVLERDYRHCAYCGDVGRLDIAHYVSRAKGGLGIEQNLVTLCRLCHHNTDQTTKRKHYLDFMKAYLDVRYPDFNHEDRFYKKGGI